MRKQWHSKRITTQLIYDIYTIKETILIGTPKLDILPHNHKIIDITKFKFTLGYCVRLPSLVKYIITPIYLVSMAFIIKFPYILVQYELYRKLLNSTFRCNSNHMYLMLFA